MLLKVRLLIGFPTVNEMGAGMRVGLEKVTSAKTVLAGLVLDTLLLGA